MIRLLALLVALVVLPLHAEAQLGVHISNSDPRWGEKITISYIAPDTSAFAKPDCHDTLYCAVIIKGARPEHALILPMTRGSGESYSAAFAVPDSTYSIQIEIAIPKAIAPGGSHGFTCRTAEGRPTPGYESEKLDDISGALERELTAYPRNYSAYFHAYDFGKIISQANGGNSSDSAWRAVATGYAQRIRSHPDTTLAYWITLAALYSRAEDDSNAKDVFMQASRCQAYDPIVNDGMFWGRFLYPQLKNGKYESSSPAARVLIPLFERFPRSAMVAEWLHMSEYDTLLPASAFRNITEAWATSNNVDVLRSIAQGYAYEKNARYDPKQAMLWCNRADHALRSGAAFYSGEYVYGYEGRVGAIAAIKIGLLDRAGKIDDIVAYAREVTPAATLPYDKKNLGLALAKAYLHADRLEDAKRTYGEQIALGTKGKLDGLDQLYAKAKEGDETLSAFSKRLAKQYGGAIHLPAIPDFRFQTLDSMSGSLAGLRGKVVVLDCWFISCPGCNTEKKSLDRLVDSFLGDTNVVFLSIATDGEKALRRWLETHESKFRIVPNGYSICQKMGVTGFPTHIIIGKDGATFGFEIGGSETADQDMRPKIEAALHPM